MGKYPKKKQWSLFTVTNPIGSVFKCSDVPYMHLEVMDEWLLGFHGLVHREGKENEEKQKSGGKVE